MQEQHLRQVHLSRLSPVMWSYQQGYPRKTLGVPIQPAYGMSGCGCGLGQAPRTNRTSQTRACDVCCNVLLVAGLYLLVTGFLSAYELMSISKKEKEKESSSTAEEAEETEDVDISALSALSALSAIQD